MKKQILLLFLMLCCSCVHNAETEIYQNKRDKTINIHDKIKEINIEEVLIGRSNQIRILGDFLIIGDYKAMDKLIHLFAKDRFSYITSTGYLGQGPGEIANMGHIEANETDREFYVTDHGKQKIFSYNLDSVLINPSYMPRVKMELNEKQFPSEYKYINDTLCIGRIIMPMGNYGFKESVAKWNITTGAIIPMKYEHPEIEKKRSALAVSVKNNMYAECYNYHDLMTICDLDGNIKYNVYGPKWDNETTNKISYYGDVEFCNDKIIATYSGEESFIKSQNGQIESKLPTKFLVFDRNGNYIKTLETEYRIIRFCYDEDNNRIIMSLNDDIQFAYFDLDGLI
ncbi:BF3164 family lipoprotein [Parabacteroides bouchesdurhonensis]|uniref:BF3164 family lipoprotein n=1 Tax=Parabacteroides bouchesdurhonensis TaxID=1936995 RepID=UPI000C858A41|nr:BF3164 family lipoprotein [Parabacteroides bouchesdurhonensis]